MIIKTGALITSLRQAAAITAGQTHATSQHGP
jgi:geranylgeranyl pyrophosphate synthase